MKHDKMKIIELIQGIQKWADQSVILFAIYANLKISKVSQQIQAGKAREKLEKNVLKANHNLDASIKTIGAGSFSKFYSAHNLSKSSITAAIKVIDITRHRP